MKKLYMIFVIGVGLMAVGCTHRSIDVEGSASLVDSTTTTAKTLEHSAPAPDGDPDQGAASGTPTPRDAVESSGNAAAGNTAAGNTAAGNTAAGDPGETTGTTLDAGQSTAGASTAEASTARSGPSTSRLDPNVEHKISFDDLNCGMQADIVFRDWMLTDRVKELDGQIVRVAGYMHPDVKQKGITEFILLRNTECKFGPTGQADHLIRVKLAPGVTTSFSTKPVEVVGKLTVNPFTGPDDKTWSIFDMVGKSVQPPRR